MRRAAVACASRALRAGLAQPGVASTSGTAVESVRAAAVAYVQRGSGQVAGWAAGGWQARWSHCACSGDMNLPPPKKVVVEYHPEEVDAFIALADELEETFEGIIVDGVEVEDRPQAFDVRLEDGSVVYSRSSGGRLPTHTAIIHHLTQAGIPVATA